jgi:hypothetical protein
MEMSGSGDAFWTDYVASYARELAGANADDAYHSLLETQPAVVPFLITAFRKEESASLRQKLVAIIWQHRLPQTIPFLLEALADPEHSIWKSALDGLVNLGEPALVPLTDLKEIWQRQGTRSDRVEWIVEAVEQIRKCVFPASIGDTNEAGGL